MASPTSSPYTAVRPKARASLPVHSPVAPRWNPTLPWPDFEFNAKWDHRRPKLQLMWSFPQICLDTEASSNQQLHIFFMNFHWLFLIIPCTTPIGIRNEVLALVWKGIRQHDIAGRMGLTRVIVNRILRRYVATKTLPGEFMGAPRKTTPHLDHVFFKMVDRIAS